MNTDMSSTGSGMRRTMFVAVSTLAIGLTGCANIQDTGGLESQIAEVEKGDFGLCMDESYRAAVELQEARMRLQELKEGSPSDTDMREGLRAAKVAAELRAKAEERCTREGRMANAADAARIAELQEQLTLLSNRLRDLEASGEVLRGVTFETNSARLTPQAHAVLLAQAEKLARKGARVEVAGHASAVGTDARNLELSRKRAEAVRAYLIQAGLDGETIVAKGYGSINPIASNQTAQGRRANQRIELHYIQ